MQSGKPEELTPRQRQCLRLLLTGRSAKEIGIQLGLSGFTVENHLKAARKSLGVTDSGEAARILDAYERSPSQSLASQPSALAESVEPPPDSEPKPALGMPPEAGAPHEPERPMHFEPLWPAPRRRLGWILRHKGQRFHDLDREQRILATIGLTWFVTISAAMTLVGLVTLLHWLAGVAKTGG